MSVLPMAALTVATSVVLWSGLTYLISRRDRRVVFLILLALPMSTLANLAVKSPLAVLVVSVSRPSPSFQTYRPAWFLAFLFLAPFTEEAIKLLPSIHGKVKAIAKGRRGSVSVGMALGVGSGLGEAL